MFTIVTISLWGHFLSRIFTDPNSCEKMNNSVDGNSTLLSTKTLLYVQYLLYTAGDSINLILSLPTNAYVLWLIVSGGRWWPQMFSLSTWPCLIYSPACPVWRLYSIITSWITSKRMVFYGALRFSVRVSSLLAVPCSSVVSVWSATWRWSTQ